MTGKKICCIFNGAAHYRVPIFKLMDKELECDFYMGNRIAVEIMDYSVLKGFKGILPSLSVYSNFYWQKGAASLFFKPYNNYLISGEPFCLSTWIILFLNRLFGKKTYLWTHGWYGRESAVKRVIKNIFFGLSHHIFLYGDYARKLMIKEGYNADKLSCIYNSLDYDNQLMIRKELSPSGIYSGHFKNDFRNLMFVGRLTSEKRFDWLLRALSLLKDEGEIFNLTLIGNGEAREYLEELTKKLGLEDCIWFYGACYKETELAELIYNADLCVSPGNVGLTAIHSMTYGTPVITHDNFPYQGPEFEVIFEGVTGTFFEYSNIPSLASAVLRWFANAPQRDVIRNNCYEVIDNRYNPYVQIELLKKILL
ncbi:glycosyltransferase [uncultured Bacteroides sp.]|uniref:glycosyltransferase n=1 Tax=uncultured Bacteroides sp. TaxID=162156 RepID=UPI002AAAE1FE|nr:glycosyltransferase [uncultured Bacteroides sp.]